MVILHPWPQRDILRRDVENAFANAGFRTAFLPGRAARRYPLINMAEDSDHVYVQALAPGIAPESLDLAITGNMLTIAGETRRHPEDITPEALHRSERAAGKFVRTIELPVEVDAANIHAEYKQGLLRVTLPKAAAAKPHQIAVTVA